MPENNQVELISSGKPPPELIVKIFAPPTQTVPWQWSADASVSEVLPDGHKAVATLIGPISDRYGIYFFGMRFIFTGLVFALPPTPPALASTSQLHLVTPIYSTPEYIADPYQEVSMLAVEKRTGLVRRIVGKLQLYVPDSIPDKPNACKLSDATCSLVKTQSKVTVKAKRPAYSQADYLAELAHVMAQKAVGVEAQIRIDFFARHTQRSKSSLYRELGKTFPLPTKRGRASYWKFSQAVAYAEASKPQQGSDGVAA